MTGISVIREADRVVAASDATSGMTREVAFSGDDAWVGFVTAAAHRPSGWHHHGGYETYFYVKSGGIRMEFGPGGSDSIEAGPGDFVHVPHGVIHREVNHTDDEATLVLVRVGSGPPVVNVEGPARD